MVRTANCQWLLVIGTPPPKQRLSGCWGLSACGGRVLVSNTFGVGTGDPYRATSLKSGCAVSGLIADSRTMIDRARVEAQNHWFMYNERMKVESVALAVSNLAIQFGDADAETAMSRPFGVAMLFGGIDENGTQLYHMDPSGTFVRYSAKAIGSGSEGAQQSLEETYHKSITLKEALKSALTILKQVMEEKLNASNVELATVTPENNFQMYSKEELETLIASI